MTIKIGIEQKDRQAVIQLLNKLVADEAVLYIKTLNYHWNVYGQDFKPLHMFFQEQYETLLDILDEIAERVRALDGVSFGSMQQYLKNARIKEQGEDVPNAHEMVVNLQQDHEAIIRVLREDIETCVTYHDMGTNNFLTEIMERHEKMAWMLRATAQK